MTYFQPERVESSFNTFSNANTIFFLLSFFKEVNAVRIATDPAAGLSHRFTDVVRWSMSFAVRVESAQYIDC